MRNSKVFGFPLTFWLCACTLFSPGVPGQGIRGTVLLGPHCPVVVEGKECPDTPYETDLVLTTSDGAREVTRFSSDASGFFQVLLPVREYAIRSPQGTQLPYCSSNGTFNVLEGQMTEIVVHCDTGIR